MFILLTIIHVFVCVFLIIVVLLQSGKAADLAGAFGGMGSQTAFGPRGSATLLSKATTVSAVLFMITSLSLSIFATRRGGTSSTVLDKQKEPKQSAPAKPGPAAPGAPGVPPGRPSVTLTPEGGGPSRTIPLDIPPPPGQGQAPGKPDTPPAQPKPAPQKK